MTNRLMMMLMYNTEPLGWVMICTGWLIVDIMVRGTPLILVDINCLFSYLKIGSFEQTGAKYLKIMVHHGWQYWPEVKINECCYYG